MTMKVYVQHNILLRLQVANAQDDCKEGITIDKSTEQPEHRSQSSIFSRQPRGDGWLVLESCVVVSPIRTEPICIRNKAKLDL